MFSVTDLKALAKRIAYNTIEAVYKPNAITDTNAVLLANFKAACEPYEHLWDLPVYKMS